MTVVSRGHLKYNVQERGEKTVSGCLVPAVQADVPYMFPPEQSSRAIDDAVKSKYPHRHLSKLRECLHSDNKDCEHECNADGRLNGEISDGAAGLHVWEQG